MTDGVDKCANTPAGAMVDASGCPVDSDNDGVPDGIDQCAGYACRHEGRRSRLLRRMRTTTAFRTTRTSARTRLPARGSTSRRLPDRAVREGDRAARQGPDHRRARFISRPRSGTSFPSHDPSSTTSARSSSSGRRLKIEIGGHADARGSDAYNLTLSEKRAQAVLDYLITKFPQINGGQYTAKGYGEQPAGRVQQDGGRHGEEPPRRVQGAQHRGADEGT